MRKTSLVLLLCAMNAHGETPTKAVFPGNQAVEEVNGKRIVKYPKPGVIQLGAGAFREQPTKVAVPVTSKLFGSNSGPALMMIEGPNGLLECSELAVADSICRPSTVGVEKHARQWLVLLQGKWTLCQRPDGHEPAKHDGYICTIDVSPGRAFVKLIPNE